MSARQGAEDGSASTVLRIALALLVVASHAPYLLSGQTGSQPLAWPAVGNLGDMAVNAFLALSGFLVTGSALRHDGIASFARARAARIFPALWLHAVAGALIAAALMSQDGVMGHLTSSKVWADAGRIAIGMWKDYAITGSDGELGMVFSSNPDVRWNEPLWTIKYEIFCYAISGGLAMIAPHADGRRRILWMSALILAAPAAHAAAFGSGPAMPWERLTACYAIGSIAFLAGASRRTLALIGAASGVETATWLGSHAAQPLSWLAVGALAIAIAQGRFGVKLPDVSYGIYIWAWPVSQALIATGWGGDPLTLWATTATASAAIALMSWGMVESPMRTFMRARP